VDGGIEFRILGSMEVLDRGRPLTLPSGRGRALLALLVLHAGEVVSADRLVDELWGEAPPATANTVVQGLVSRLRKMLEPGRNKGETPTVLQTAATGYRLSIEPGSVDANRFKQLLDQARGVAAPVRSAQLAEALRLWRGPALADFTYEPFAQRAITALEELRVVALEERIEADLALGRNAELVPEVEQLIGTHPFRERLRGQLMVALYRAGRQADALEAYRDARRVLVEELGIEPGPALRALEGAILKQNSSLGLQPEVRHEVPESVPTSERWLPRERRTVTVVWSDLAASGEPRADPEALGRLTARSLKVATDVLRRHGARVEQSVGELVLALFGLPVAHEDDPIRAVRAALELRGALQMLNKDVEAGSGLRFSARAGIETGEIVVGGPAGSPGAKASGQVITQAARLQQAANEGEVIVGEATQRLIRGAVVLKAAPDIVVEGSGGGGAAWRVLDMVSGAAAVANQLDSPMCGRQTELSRVRSAFRRTARSGSASRFTVVGEAGIGKSRLAKEFVESIGSDARIITGRCPAYGEGITFLPLREAVLGAAGPGGWPVLAELLKAHGDARAADQIAGAIGLTQQQGKADELFPAARRLFQALAARQPLVVVLEDVHWAEPTLLDLIEYLGRHVTARVFLLCLARSELTEVRPDWSASGPSAEMLVLEPLSAPEIEQLIVDRAGATITAETLRRIVETARGNPLFAEQLLAAFNDDDDVALIPASLESLLAVRLDRLGPGERDLLRCASVIGIDFDEDALIALLPDEARPFVDRHLATLERKQLLVRTTRTIFGFRHVLVQLAAYKSMTRNDRARLHERFADWLESGAPEPPPELDEIVGYHLEQAIEHHRAGGDVDATGSGLAARAGDRLASAAERALTRLDLTAAANLLSRAGALLPSDHPRRPFVTQRLAETYLVLGRFTQAQELLMRLAEVARARGDLAYERSARLEHARIQFVVGPDPVPLASIRQQAEEAAAFYANTDDEGGQARAWFVLGCVHMRAGKIRAAEREFRESLAHADRSGQIREELAARWLLATLIVLGPDPVRLSIDRCQQLATVRGTEHPGVLTELAILFAMVGRFDEGRELNERARTIIVERMHVRRMLRFVAQADATVEVLAGDVAAAESALRVALELTRESNERDPVSQIAARLATVVRAQGRLEEAASFALLSEEAAPSEGVEARALSLAATARSASDRGKHQEAEARAREAVSLVPKEMLSLRADVLVELAEVLRAGSQRHGALEAVREAMRLYERKGDTVSAVRITLHIPVR
jgi:DNA-binding SARP family transcriptional activator/tetratricopeptide (TPR) repeat protein